MHLKLSKSILTSEYWGTNKPYCELRALLDLAFNVFRGDGWTTIEGKRTFLKRGSIPMSLRALSKRWHWSWRRTKTFVDRFKNVTTNVTTDVSNPMLTLDMLNDLIIFDDGTTNVTTNVSGGCATEQSGMGLTPALNSTVTTVTDALVVVDDWASSVRLNEYSDHQPGVSLEWALSKFAKHWQRKGGTKTPGEWDAAFRGWLKMERPPKPVTASETCQSSGEWERLVASGQQYVCPILGQVDPKHFTLCAHAPSYAEYIVTGQQVHWRNWQPALTQEVA